MAVCKSCGAELSAGTGQQLCAKCSAVASSASAQADTAQASQQKSNAFSAHISAFPITSLLIAINLAVFIGIVTTGLRLLPFSWGVFLALIQHPAPDLLVRWGANYGPLTTSGPWWQWLRLLTNTFVHIGIVHLVVNMWALLNLGALAEYLFGRKTTLITYLLTGIAGSVTSLAWHPQVVSAGASGAIFGIAGALLVAFRFARLPLSKRVVRSTSASLLIFAGYTLAYGLVTGRMDNAAHLGGLGAGLLFGLALLFSDRRAETSQREELRLGNAAALALTAAVLIAAVIVGRAQRYIAPFTRGEGELRANNFSAAITDIRHAITLRPNLVAPHVTLAEAYMRVGQAASAEAQLKEAVTLGPRDAAAWRELGFLYLGTRRPQEGVYAFGRAAELEPKSAENQTGYAVALQMAGRLPEAIAAYQKALQLNPSFYGARYNLALAYIQSGKLDDAISTLKQYLDQQRADPQAWAALAEAYRQKGMMAEAQDAQQRAQALRPRGSNQQ